MDHYRNKVAIVTGGASGIGRALCDALGRRGANVLVTDINVDGAERAARAITAAGGRARAARLDVTKEEDVLRLVRETASEHGRLDFMFNNAGIVTIAEVRDTDLTHWHRIIDVNLKGVVYGTLAAYQVMVKQGFGHIVNIASAAGLGPFPLFASYVMTKHGVVGLSQTLRLEGAGLGVKVSVVCPGFVRTEIFDTAPVINAPRNEIISKVPRGIIVTAAVAAQKILKGVARNKAVIVFPLSARVLLWLTRLFPFLGLPVAGRVLRDFRAFRRAP